MKTTENEQSPSLDPLGRLLPARGKRCNCNLCKSGRFIRSIARKLKRADARNLTQWYDALLDEQCEQEMKLAHMEEQLASSKEPTDGSSETGGTGA